MTACGNITMSTYSTLQQAFSVYVTFPLVVIGLAGNVFAIHFLRSEYLPLRTMRPLVEYTAIADSLILLSSLMMLTFPTLAEMIQPPIDSVQGLSWVKARVMIMFYPLAHTARTMSTWLSTASTVIRFLIVQLPHRLEGLSLSRSKRAVTFISIFAVLYNMPRWFELETFYCIKGPGFNGLYWFVAPSLLRIIPAYKEAYLGWMYSIFMLVIPVLIILPANISLTWKLSRSRKDSRESVHGPIKKVQEILLSEMSLVLGREYLICSVLPLVNNILEILLDNELVSITPTLHTTYKVLVPISNLTVTLNAMANTAMYLWLARKYERLLAGNLYTELEGLTYATSILVRNAVVPYTSDMD